MSEATQIKLVNVRGSRVMPNLPDFLAFTQGDIWHVKPGTGSDSNTGGRPDRAFKTLKKAQSAATAQTFARRRYHRLSNFAGS